jgi:hypothetical protein
MKSFKYDLKPDSGETFKEMKGPLEGAGVKLSRQIIFLKCESTGG